MKDAAARGAVKLGLLIAEQLALYTAPHGRVLMGKNRADSRDPVQGTQRARPLGWKDGKTAPTEAIGSILASGREDKMEILVYISYTEVGASAPVLDNQGG